MNLSELLSQHMDAILALAGPLAILFIYVLRKYAFKDKESAIAQEINGLVLKTFQSVEKLAENDELTSNEKLNTFISLFTEEYIQRTQKDDVPDDILEVALNMVETIVFELNHERYKK